MKTEESLYIRILIWAYEKSTKGFTETELFDEFGLTSNPDLQYWYLKVFRNSGLNNSPMIDVYKNVHVGNSIFCLTEKGSTAAIDYLLLKESQESGNQAKIIAYWSIGIVIVVGLIQIVLAIVQIHLAFNQVH